ncbi:MAG: endolytic transglycosylase MltG, partial [Flavobacteriales bacterium]
MSRLYKKSILSKDAVEQILNENESLNLFDFVPIKGKGTIALEGIFVPGLYEFDNLTINPQNEDYIINSRIIINHLLEKAKYRFAYKKMTRGISFYELLTMASIVEKEDAFDTHANVIASVFWNRLKNNDRFSSCVTVEYILGYHRPFLLFSDLDKAAKSPYSTYHHRGIPPTPICFVTDYTIENTINSNETDFYFFVLDWVARVPYMSS